MCYHRMSILSMLISQDTDIVDIDNTLSISASPDTARDTHLQRHVTHPFRALLHADAVLYRYWHRISIASARCIDINIDTGDHTIFNDITPDLSSDTHLEFDLPPPLRALLHVNAVPLESLPFLYIFQKRKEISWRGS